MFTNDEKFSSKLKKKSDEIFMKSVDLNESTDKTTSTREKLLRGSVSSTLTVTTTGLSLFNDEVQILHIACRQTVSNSSVSKPSLL